jgi:hypothetical protein
MRRYPVVGGAAAWRLPLVTAMLTLAGLALGTWAMAAGVLVLGWIVHRLWRSVVIEVSPDGLARGLALDGAFVGPRASMGWRSVVAVDTEWWGPDDHRALETSVRSRDGTTIRVSTAMGLRSYRACLAEIVRRAPWAVRSGITEATLADGPPAGRDLIAAARTAGALALVVGAMLGFGYVLAQGRSSHARYLEETAVGPPPQRAECRARARIAAGSPADGCRPGPDAEAAPHR